MSTYEAFFDVAAATGDLAAFEAPALPGVDELLARAQLCRILAGVFVEEPSAAFLQALRVPEMLQSLAGMGVGFDADFLQADLAALEEDLACEYATLFASSGGFPPVESVRLNGRFKQEPHYQVLQVYQRLGFEVRRGRFEVFADQLGIELGFVAELLEQCAASLACGEDAGFARLDKELKRFWALHLGRWVRGYAELITRAARHSFYREMARVLAGFAAEEIAALGLSKLEDLDRGQLEVPKQEVKLEFNADEPVCGACPPARPDAAPARVIPIAPLRDFQF